jgi:hypothetical protein
MRVSCRVPSRFTKEPSVKNEPQLRFDLTDLRLFCDVVDAGAITRGAERSALALAAASTRIRNMEATLGAPRLTR